MSDIKLGKTSVSGTESNEGLGGTGNLQKDLNHIRELVNKSDGREKFFMALVTVIFSVGTAVSTYSVYDNSSRARESVERAERLVEQISGISRPIAVQYLKPLIESQKGELIATYDIASNWYQSPGTYGFLFSVPIIGKTSGAPGRIIGIEYKMDGPIVDFLSTRSDGTISQSTRKKYMSELYSSTTINQTIEGVLVARNGTFSLSTTNSRTFISCEDGYDNAENFIEMTEGYIGSISIRPVFSDIENLPNFTTFQMILPQGEDIFCPHLNEIAEPVIVVEPAEAAPVVDVVEQK